MRLLRQCLTVLFALCALIAGGLFALQNTQAVPLDLLLFQLPEQSIAIWLLLALGSGCAAWLGGWIADCASPRSHSPSPP